MAGAQHTLIVRSQGLGVWRLQVETTARFSRVISIVDDDEVTRQQVVYAVHTWVFLSTSETRSAAPCYHEAGIAVTFSFQSATFTVGCVVSIFTSTQQR